MRPAQQLRSDRPHGRGTKARTNVNASPRRALRQHEREADVIDAAVEKRVGEVDAADAEKDRRLLASVQRKLRQRSRGKFYADGWSTSQSRVNYALVAAVMLVVIVAVYLALGPMGISLH